MVNWKSLFFIWLPLALVLSIIHDVLWGDYDMSSFYFGMLFVFLGGLLDTVFGYET